VGTFYWCAEYGKVLLSYVLLMFVYPSVMFRSYLKGKGRVFWFCFCVSSQIVLISTVVLLLGLFHLLNVWVCRILFYGSLIWSVSRSVRLEMTPRYLIYKVNNRTYGVKLLLLKLGEAVSGALKKTGGLIRRMVKGNFIELAALAAIVLYGMIYFGYGAFQEHYYGFGDMYVHHAWIYGLAQGKSFSSGIYPEGMHAVIYALHTLFGIRVHSIILYLQCVHVAVFLLSAYFLIRELFPWRYSGLIVLTIFLTMGQACFEEVHSISRLQWTLPQEFALFTVFTIPLFLVRCLKNAGRLKRGEKETRMFWSDDLVVFLLGIAVTVSVHFYAMFMAIFACIGVAIVWWRRLFDWHRFVPVMVSAVLAVMLAIAPMGIAFVKGIPFQGSFDWALGVMEGKYDQTGSIEVIDQAQHEGPETQGTGQSTFLEKMRAAGESMRNMERHLYGEKFGTILWYSCLLCLSAWLLWRGLGWLLKIIFRCKSFPAELFDGYGTVGMISFMFMMMLSSSALGIPALVAWVRLCAVKHMFLMALLTIPIDFAGTLLARFSRTWTMQCMGVVSAAAALYIIVASGNYHGYLYYEGSRYPAAAEVSNSIIDSTPKDQFTIVSTTDEIYQINEYGFHEEYLSFLEKYREDSYYLPTPYVFFFVEKHPLQYGQRHFFNGPDWLALPRYQGYERDVSSLCPDMLKGEIADEKADREIVTAGTEMPTDNLALSKILLFDRETIESAAARYIRILCSQYPNNVSVYYEDEDFVCYCLKQNPDRLIELKYPAP